MMLLVTVAPLQRVAAMVCVAAFRSASGLPPMIAALSLPLGLTGSGGLTASLNAPVTPLPVWAMMLVGAVPTWPLMPWLAEATLSVVLPSGMAVTSGVIASWMALGMLPLGWRLRRTRYVGSAASLTAPGRPWAVRAAKVWLVTCWRGRMNAEPAAMMLDW